MLPLTPEELTAQDKATTCHISKTKFVNSDKIIKDHDHFTGKYRGTQSL